MRWTEKCQWAVLGFPACSQRRNRDARVLTADRFIQGGVELAPQVQLNSCCHRSLNDKIGVDERGRPTYKRILYAKNTAAGMRFLRGGHTKKEIGNEWR